MKRFLPIAVIVALVGVAVTVVVISSGQGPKQPSVDQKVSPADELPPSLRVQLGRDIELDRVRSVECGAGRRAPVDVTSRLSPSGGATCRISLGGPADIIAFKRGAEWQILRAVAAPELRRMAERSSKPIERVKDDIRRLAEAQRTGAAPFHGGVVSYHYGEVYSTIR